MWHWKFKLLRGSALLRLKRIEETAVLLKEPVPAGPAFAEVAARHQLLQGRYQMATGKSAAAEATLERARHRADAGSDVVAEAENLLAFLALSRKDWDSAIPLLRAVADRTRRIGDRITESNAVQNLGRVLYEQEHWEEAAALFQRSIELAGDKPSDSALMAMINLGICGYRLGDLELSTRFLQRAVDGSRATGRDEYLLRALGEFGNLYIVRDRARQALPYLEQAFTLARKMGAAGDAARQATNLAIAYADLKEWAQAETYNQQAIALKGKTEAASLTYNTINAGYIALGRGDPAAARHLFDAALERGGSNRGVEWEAQAGLADTAWAVQNFPAAERHFQAAIQAVEKTRGALRRTESRVGFLSSLIRFYRRYVDFLMERGDTVRALAVVESSRGRVLAERLGARADRLAPAVLESVAVAANTVLLSYWLGPGRSWLWVVHSKGTMALPLPPAGEITALVDQYSAAIRNQLDPLATPFNAAGALFEKLVKPAAALIPRGSKVIIVPDGALHGLNFETLPVYDDRPHFWLEDVELTVAPSLAVWQANAKRRHLATKRLLLIGDPVEVEPGFPRLKHAARELNTIEQRLQVAAVRKRQEAATPEAFLGAMPGQATHIHFAAHAVANAESPLDSAVILSRGSGGRYKLYARDVVDLQLAADLVTISACRGAGSRAYSGEGLVGFAWAFLRAGARQVVAGLWDVDDLATAQLMEDFYGELAAGKPPSTALRAAKRALMESRAALRKPYYWGALQLYTAGR